MKTIEIQLQETELYFQKIEMIDQCITGISSMETIFICHKEIENKWIDTILTSLECLHKYSLEFEQRNINVAMAHLRAFKEDFGLGEKFKLESLRLAKRELILLKQRLEDL